ncbi:MAG: hypothetical protein IIW66_02885, partial [Bacteroidales bacterium]|nr:hypothetical protein [Bacteroidales bacterium]
MEIDKVVECAFAKAFINRPKLANVLLDKYSSAEEIYSLPTTDLYEEVGEDFAKKIFSDQNLRWAEREVKWAESKGVKLLFRGEEGDPELLCECDDAPV